MKEKIIETIFYENNVFKSYPSRACVNCWISCSIVSKRLTTTLGIVVVCLEKLQIKDLTMNLDENSVLKSYP